MFSRFGATESRTLRDLISLAIKYNNDNSLDNAQPPSSGVSSKTIIIIIIVVFLGFGYYLYKLN